jgi:hypothetical protein
MHRLIRGRKGRAHRSGKVLHLLAALTLVACGSPREYDPCSNNRCKDGSVSLDSPIGSGGAGGGTGGPGGVGGEPTSHGGGGGEAVTTSGGIGNPGSGGKGPGGMGVGVPGSGGISTGGIGSAGTGSGGTSAGGTSAGGTSAGGAATGGSGSSGCAKGTKKCAGTQPQTCDDNGSWQNTGSPCAVCTACDATSGTCKPANGGICDDHDFCTQTDTCQGGVCVGSNPKPCLASDQCHNAGTCNPMTGLCSNPPKIDGQMCDDGMACTDPDTCMGGVCVGAPILCNSPPACKKATTCSARACNYSQNLSDGTADAKCSALTPVCASGMCVQCTMDQHCSGATPSCNPSSHACVCRRPSSANLLVNPGFDGSFAGWQTTAPFAVLVADSEGCAASNATYLENSGDDPYQCISIAAGTSYFVGARFRGGGVGNGGFIRLGFYTAPGCIGTYIDAEYKLSNYETSNTWTPLSGMVVAPAGAQSARVSLSGVQEYFDQVYVNSVSSRY